MFLIVQNSQLTIVKGKKSGLIIIMNITKIVLTIQMIDLAF
jgi:hypothetical protein